MYQYVLQFVFFNISLNKLVYFLQRSLFSDISFPEKLYR